MRHFYLEGLCQSQKLYSSVLWLTKTVEVKTSPCNLPPLHATWLLNKVPVWLDHLLTYTGEQRGSGGLTNITISSQVACDHRKLFRAELVRTSPDGLGTSTRSSKVRKTWKMSNQKPWILLARIFDSSIWLVQYHRQCVKLMAVFSRLSPSLHASSLC